jgi:hypothetical protein
MIWAYRYIPTWGTIGWLMNVPYSRLEIVSPDTSFDGYYRKSADLPGLSTPYWEYFGWFWTGGLSGLETKEVWGEQPLFPTVKYVHSYDVGGGRFDIYLGAETFTDSNYWYNRWFHSRYPLDRIDVRILRDGVEIPIDWLDVWYWFWGDYYIRLSGQQPPASYTLRTVARENQTLSTETILEYDFKLNDDGSISKAPVVTNIDVKDLTLNNTLEKPKVDIEFQLWNETAIQQITFEYSTDGGATWLKAPVNIASPNTYTTSFTVYGQKYISIRINATDTNNLKTSITILNGFYLNVPLGFGRLRVETIPPVPTRIFVNNIVRNCWGLDWVRLPPGNYYLSFSDVAYRETPKFVVVTIWPENVTRILSLSEPIPIYEGKTTEVKAYFEPLGSLRIETHPPLPVTIYIDGVPRNEWGLWVDIEPGTYTITFEPYDGYLTPPSINVSVVRGALTHIIGNYTDGTVRIISSP